MSHMRVKEKMLQEKDLAFEQYLKHYMNKPTEDKPSTMEQKTKAKNIPSVFRPLNNIFYNNPLQGA
jgi:hypothetical protein